MGSWKTARPYFSSGKQALLDRYVKYISDGHDKALSNKKRASSFWNAAIMAKGKARSILSAHSEPIWYSSNPAKNIVASKTRKIPDSSVLLRISTGERLRTNKYLKEYGREVYYRYVALAHAWNALKLMPDQDSLTAKMFCVSADWIKHHDPESVDRFYKALVRRCGKTELGKKADELRWFPKIKITEKEITEALCNK